MVMKSMRFKRVPVRKHIRKGNQVKAYNKLIRQNRGALRIKLVDLPPKKKLDRDVAILSAPLQNPQIFQEVPFEELLSRQEMKAKELSRPLSSIQFKTPKLRDVEEETIIPLRIKVDEIGQRSLLKRHGLTKAGLRVGEEAVPLKIKKELGELPRQRKYRRFIKGRLSKDFITTVD